MILKSKGELVNWLKDNPKIANFKAEEFYCKCGCNELLLDTDLVEYLQDLRVELGTPIKINSGYRCTKRNKEVGGKEDSQHLLGKAVDISCTTSTQRHKLLQLCLKYFNSVGINSRFIHVDTRDTVAIAFMY